MTDRLPPRPNDRPASPNGRPKNAEPSATPRRRMAAFQLERRRAIRYRISVTIAAILSWVVWLTPPPLRRRIADLGGDIFYRWFPTYRASIQSNLRVVLANADEAEIDRAARAASRASARNFADLLIVPHINRRQVVRVDPLVEGSWSYLDDALKGGKGAVIVTAHVGPFDYVSQMLHHRGYKITSVTGRTTSRFVFDGVTWLRRSNDASIVEASPSGVRKVLQALKRGECAAFLSDYDFFQSGVPVTFFGKPTRLPQGPVRIARDTGAPIVPLFSRRIGNRHAMILMPPFVVEKTRDLDADLARGLEKVVACLEYAISRTPDQWVMFQRVWPSEPAAPGRVAPDTARPATEPVAMAGA